MKPINRIEKHAIAGCPWRTPAYRIDSASMPLAGKENKGHDDVNMGQSPTIRMSVAFFSAVF